MRAEIPTYYDQPPLKPTFYGWKVSTYMLVSGLGGSAQIIATLADLTGREDASEVVRQGRYLALASAAIGAPLLILDLHTPQRFYNMLRIFRPTSPMSIGSYMLIGFGGVSALLAGMQLLKDSGVVKDHAVGGVLVEAAAKTLDLPAAILGAAMSTYTGALLAATSNPLWAAAPRVLPSLFGASAMASSAALLSQTSGGPKGALEGIETIASIVEIYLLGVWRRRLSAAGVATPVPIAPLELLAAAPIVHRLAALIENPRAADEKTRRRAALFGAATAVAVVAGAFLLRHLTLTAGNRSARRPRDYFRFAGAR